MSQIFYAGDNLVVTGSKGFCTTSTEDSIAQIPTIRLIFTIFVNGKMKNIFKEYQVEWYQYKNPDGSEGSSGEYTFKDWIGIQDLIQALKDIGYAQDIMMSDLRRWLECCGD